MFRTFKTSTYSFTAAKGKLKFPEKLKGTILEKWADYWKNLFIDYRQMLQDLRTDIQDEPKKAMKWATTLITCYLLAKNNPNEIDFQDDLRKLTNEILIVSEDCRNPTSMDHLRFLQICYNEGVIHYKNFGIGSVMYLSEYSDKCSLYKTQCSYLQPSYFKFPVQIIDVGIMGRWWNIYAKSTDYDIKN